MRFWDKVKLWFNKHKKSILIGGSFILILIGSGVGYVLCKNGRVPISDWLKIASKDELNQAYRELMKDYNKTGKKSFLMEQISQELGLRDAAEWFEKHPPNLDPNYRWTDKSRWE